MLQQTCVIFDIDGVLCNLSARLLATWNDRHPGTQLDEPTAWLVAEAYPELDADDLRWWREAYDNPYYYATAELTPGAAAAVFGARTLGYAVRFRSSRPAHLHATTRAWLEDRGLLSPHDPDDFLICGPRAKQDALHLPYAQLVFIDDSDQQLGSIVVLNGKHPRPTQYWLIDRPYNAGNTVFRRVEVPEIPFYLHRLADANGAPR